jgi:hypothetical protein
MNIPQEWSEIDGSLWKTDWGGDSFVAASILASADIKAYNSTYGESGVFFAASDRLGQLGGYIQLLDGTKGWYEEDCKFDYRSDYKDIVYEGKFDVWKNCSDTDGVVLILAARPINNPEAFLILVEVKLINNADLTALNQILATFEVVPAVNPQDEIRMNEGSIRNSVVACQLPAWSFALRGWVT